MLALMNVLGGRGYAIFLGMCYMMDEMRCHREKYECWWKITNFLLQIIKIMYSTLNVVFVILKWIWFFVVQVLTIFRISQTFIFVYLLSKHAHNIHVLITINLWVVNLRLMPSYVIENWIRAIKYLLSVIFSCVWEINS